MSSSTEDIQLPEPQEEEPRRDETVVISQTTFFYFLIAVVFFAAGFVVAWVTYSTTAATVSARDVRNAAADGARQAVQTEMPGYQGTTVALASSAAAAAPAAPQATALPPTPVNIEAGNSPAWGASDAKVTIVEYSDFQCTFCERFFQLTYPQLKQQYGDKIRFVYKNFAFLTQDSEPAAIAAACAQEQGKFWEYHDALFNDQHTRGRDSYIRFATSVGVPDIAQFTQCIDSNKYAATVLADTNKGQNFGVSGTPTFFINGLPVVGAQPIEVFQASIDKALAGAGG